MHHWWSLPGPLEFCRNVAADLEEGCSVVLAIPRTMRAGLIEAIRTQMADLSSAHWRNVEGDQTDSPGQLLCHALLQDPSSIAVPTPEALAHVDELSGQVLCVEAVSTVNANWKTWRSFLESYAQASRGRSVLERAPVLFILRGSPEDRPVQEDVCLKIRRWQNCIGELDMLLYASILLRGQTADPLLRALLAGIVAAVSGADPELAEFLAREPHSCILDPRKALERFAAERGWKSHEPNWADGSFDHIDGSPRVHSGVPNRKPEELEYLLWRAQVSVILPFIEQQRRRLLVSLDSLLRVPFAIKGGTIDRKEDLEIGHIAHQISSTTGKVSEALRQHVFALQEARNALAHLEVLPPGKILTSVLRGPAL